MLLVCLFSMNGAIIVNLDCERDIVMAKICGQRAKVVEVAQRPQCLKKWPTGKLDCP